MAKSGYRVTGLKELDKKLNALEPNIFKKHARSSMTAALKPMLKDVKERAPKDTSTMVDNTKIKAAKRSRRYVGRDLTVVDKGTKESVFKVLGQEYGTKKMEANPFMRPAFDAGKGQALQAHLKRLRQAVAKEAKR